MNPLKQYNIGFVGLSEGRHSFLFELTDEFFACFEGSEIVHGSVQVELSLEKTSTMLVLDFHLSGKVETTCDRCTELFLQPIEGQRRLFVKFGETFSEHSDEIVIIASTDSHFDISQYVYEFVHLSLPVRRVHPETETGEMGCDPAQIQKLEEYLLKKDKKSEGGQSPWEVLKSLKF